MSKLKFQRTKDELVITEPDGTVQRFPLNQPPPRRMTPFRPSAIALAGLITLIVLASYHFSAELVPEALKLLNSENASDVKDGVIQMLTAVTQNVVALTAVGGLVGSVQKLCEN